MHVLLIEDELATAEAIGLMLASEGYQLHSTQSGEDGVSLGKLYDYEIILLDLNLPDMDGYDVLKELRLGKVRTPVMLLTGSSAIESKLRGFRLGADEYLTKPFHREELIARIRAVVRRSNGHSQSILRTGRLAVNLDSRTAEVNGRQVHLTDKEYATLELLSLRKGTTITPEIFLNYLYGCTNEPNAQILDVYICKLRKKLTAACGGDDYIRTVRGCGYELNDPQNAVKIA